MKAYHNHSSGINSEFLAARRQELRQLDNVPELPEQLGRDGLPATRTTHVSLLPLNSTCIISSGNEAGQPK